MQQQVMKRNMSSDLGWGSGGEGGWGLQSSAPGSGSWTSTANQDNSSNSASTWQAMGKSDSASDADDTSSVKSGSTITNMSSIASQSQESTTTSSSGPLQTSSSSPWGANPTLSGMDSSPWGNSSSTAPSSIGSMGWTSNPSSLSLSTNQGHNNSMQPGSNMGSSSGFNSTSSASASTAWPTSMGNSMASTSTLPPNMSSSNLSSQWQGSTMLGNIGDFQKSSDQGWNNPSTSMESTKDVGGANSDPRMWGLPSDKVSESQWDPSKSQWGNNTPLATGGEQGAGNTELSFAQATLKGLKVPPAASAPQTVMNSRHEEILRAIENHEGWGSRPIRQDTSWEIENSPKSHRKFSADSNAGASNVWNNSNGTAIWEAVRENQSSNWGGGGASGSSWNAEKDQPSWGGPPKPPQDPNQWNVGNGADPKSFGTWGAAGGAGDASNKMWGQKTEVGSWGESGGVQRTTSISSWGDDGDTGGWEDQRRITGGMGGMQGGLQGSMQGGMQGGMQGMVPPSPGIGGPAGMPGMVPQSMPSMNMAGMGAEATPWNDSQKPGWNPANPAAINRTKMDEPWNKPPPTRTGWGDPTQDGGKVDDGTSIWAANAPKQLPPQAKASGWGDTGPQGQWNAAVGAKPKAPAGWDEASWAMAQRAKSGRYPEESANTVEVGYWNGLPQDNNTWNDPAALRGVRKITGQQMPPKYMGGGGNPPTQMRAKLLQHLMDMGFRKEEAQNALITNNMNLEMAINDLKTNNGGMSRKDSDMDVFQANGSQPRMPHMPKMGLGSDDMTDIRPDQVPNFNNLQNTPFPNAQVPNQPFMQSNPSLPPSSLNPNASINSSFQQKLMQQKMQQQQAPPTTGLGPRNQMPPVGSGGSNQVPQQQQQQQILAQLRQAVNNGFISPQLLNYQLPHNILVLLQQLLQLQSALQTVMSKQQQMHQQARATGNRPNPQLEQMPGIIQNINQQIVNLQKQLQQAQNNLFATQKPPNMSQPPSGLMTPQPGQQPGGNIVDNLDALSSDLANVAIQSQSQSRLTTQWKAATDSAPGDGTTTPTTPGNSANLMSDEMGENKAPGSKGLLQSSSSPNLNLIPGGLGMSGDRTWSSSMSTTSSNWPLSSSDSAGTNSQADLKPSGATSTSTSSILSGMPSGLTDVIPEFIPGKPWQGLTKNVEDDPHVTPGSIQLQRSLSVNRVHDDSLNNLDGHKLSSSSSWGANLKNENSLGLSQLGNRPPPGMAPAKAVGSQQWQSGANINRQSSWGGRSGNSAFTQVGSFGGSNWNDSRNTSYTWIMLKNLHSSMDSSTVRALCAQHGTVTNFYYVAHQFVLVQYGSRDVAYVAQQRLNNFPIGSSIITAEFISEAEAQRVVQMLPTQPSAMPPMNASPWSQAPPTAPFQSSGDPWLGTMLGAQGVSSPWGPGGMWDTDRNSNPLSNILGGESM